MVGRYWLEVTVVGSNCVVWCAVGIRPGAQRCPPSYTQGSRLSGKLVYCLIINWPYAQHPCADSGTLSLGSIPKLSQYTHNDLTHCYWDPISILNDVYQIILSSGKVDKEGLGEKG